MFTLLVYSQILFKDKAVICNKIHFVLEMLQFQLKLYLSEVFMN